MGNYIKLYYYAVTWSSNVQGIQVEVRAYANSDAYALSDGWALFISQTGAYNTFEMFYRQKLDYYAN